MMQWNILKLINFQQQQYIPQQRTILLHSVLNHLNLSNGVPLRSHGHKLRHPHPRPRSAKGISADSRAEDMDLAVGGGWLHPGYFSQSSRWGRCQNMDGTYEKTTNISLSWV